MSFASQNRPENDDVILWETLTVSEYPDRFPNATILTPNNLSQPINRSEFLILDQAYNFTLEHLLISLKWKRWADKLIIVADPMPAIWKDLFPEALMIKGEQSTNQVYYYTTSLLDKIKDVMLTEDQNHWLVLTDRVNEVQKSLQGVGRPVVTGDQPLNQPSIVIADDLSQLPFYQSYSYLFDEMLTDRLEPTLTGGVREKTGYWSRDVYHARSKLAEVTYRHMSIDRFKKLPLRLTPDIYITPLHHIMLRLYSEKLSPKKVLSRLGFPEDAINFVFHHLVDNGFITISGNVKNAQKLLELPLGLRPSLIALGGSPVLAACIDNFREPIYTFLSKDIGTTADYQIDNQKYIRERYNRYRGSSDCETLLHVYNSYLGERNLEGFNREYLDDVYNTVQQITGEIPQPVDVEMELRTAEPVIEKIYSDQRLDLVLDRTVLAQYEIVAGPVYNISSASINSIEVDRPKEVYALITSENSILLSFTPILYNL